MDASPSTYFQSPQPSVAVASVTSVEANGSDGTTFWNFDTDVTSVSTGLTGLRCIGEDPISATQTGATQVRIDYPDTIAVGDHWHVDPAYAGIGFTGGATLTEDSGDTTA